MTYLEMINDMEEISKVGNLRKQVTKKAKLGFQAFAGAAVTTFATLTGTQRARSVSHKSTKACSKTCDELMGEDTRLMDDYKVIKAHKAYSKDWWKGWKETAKLDVKVSSAEGDYKNASKEAASHAADMKVMEAEKMEEAKKKLSELQEKEEEAEKKLEALKEEAQAKVEEVNALSVDDYLPQTESKAKEAPKDEQKNAEEPKSPEESFDEAINEEEPQEAHA